MGIPFAVVILILFILVLHLHNRITALDAEAKELRRQLGLQGTELTGFRTCLEREFAQMWQSIMARSPTAPGPRVISTPLTTAATVSADIVMPTRDGDLRATVTDLLGEEVPAVAVASAAMGLIQRRQRRREYVRRQRLSPMQRLARGLRSTDEWEALIGGRLLNRIGAIALILGIAFFFKYAVDQNWINQGLRVAAGLLLGTALLALAWRSYQRGYAIFGQGLVGAGQAVLYLAIYASFNFYHLAPQPVALTAMGMITAVALLQGVYYNSLAVSLLACAGGYLTPFLLTSGSSSPMGTIIYVLLLDAGTLAVLTRKPAWQVLEFIALGATYLTYFVWYASSNPTDQIVLAAVAISLFWVLFLSFDVHGTLLAPATGPAVPVTRHIAVAVNGVAYYTGLFLLLAPAHQGWLSALSLAVAAVYLTALLAVRHRQRLTPAIAAQYTLIAMILLLAATAIQFRGYTVVALWSIEALPLVWYGVRWKLWYVWRPALVIYALAAALLFGTQGALAYAPIRDFHPLVNLRMLAFLLLAGSLAASSTAFQTLVHKQREPITASLHYGWTILVFILLAIETSDTFRRLMVGVSAQSQTALQFERSLAVAVLWMCFALTITWLGLKRRYLPWLVAGLTSAGLSTGLAAVVGITYEPIARFVPVLNVRVATVVFLLGSLAALLRWFQRNSAYRWLGQLRVGVQVVALLLGFELVSAEINDYFQQRMGHPLPSMDTGGAFIELVLLATVWMLYSLLPTWYGVRRGTMPLITLGLSLGAAATGVAAFAGIVLVPSHQFALMLGIRPIVLAILVAGLLLQIRWLRASPSPYRWTANVLVAMQAAIILLGFGLISAETRDSFAQRLAGGGGSGDLRDRERLAFSLVWLAYAALIMGLGLWRRARWMRLGAIGLFACAILKVFIYDLSFLGAVYRPISFAGLGVILLAVSFLYQRYRAILLNPA